MQRVNTRSDSYWATKRGEAKKKQKKRGKTKKQKTLEFEGGSPVLKRVSPKRNTNTGGEERKEEKGGTQKAPLHGQEAQNGQRINGIESDAKN